MARPLFEFNGASKLVGLLVPGVGKNARAVSFEVARRVCGTSGPCHQTYGFLRIAAPVKARQLMTQPSSTFTVTIANSASTRRLE